GRTAAGIRWLACGDRGGVLRTDAAGEGNLHAQVRAVALNCRSTRTGASCRELSPKAASGSPRAASDGQAGAGQCNSFKASAWFTVCEISIGCVRYIFLYNQVVA